MAYYSDDNSFRLFAQNLEQAIKKYENLPEENRLIRQRRQLKLLLSLENKFRKALIAHPWGATVYKGFVELICDQKRNILAARPYFRERQQVFAADISTALKKRSDKSLYKFKFNNSFVLFTMNFHQWPENGKIAQLAKEINKIRMEILELNLPLAISQARIFWSSTPKNHLTYMDLVQIHCGGLLIAIDKFVPPDTKDMTEQEELDAYRKFRAVAIGRMIGDRIECASETLIHYFPGDKRKIYRANKVKRFAQDGTDYDKISELVNAELEPQHHTNPIEISALMASSTPVSGDTTLDPEGETTFDRYQANEELRPDLQAEEIDAIVSVRSKYKDLSLFERKFLQLKGILS